MTPLRSDSIRRWWPTTQALDLVEGNSEVVAAAVLAEISRFMGKETHSSSWCTFPNLDAAFGAAPEFVNVPTFYLVLPTHSKWSVLWNNSFLCNGYDSLCHCLATRHALTTLHWSAHDEWTSMQSGAHFHHRRASEAGVIERSVHASQQDSKWVFSERGPALAEEDLDLYKARRKRDRLNED